MRFPKNLPSRCRPPLQRSHVLHIIFGDFEWMSRAIAPIMPPPRGLPWYWNARWDQIALNDRIAHKTRINMSEVRIHWSTSMHTIFTVLKMFIPPVWHSEYQNNLESRKHRGPQKNSSVYAENFNDEEPEENDWERTANFELVHCLLMVHYLHANTFHEVHCMKVNPRSIHTHTHTLTNHSLCVCIRIVRSVSLCSVQTIVENLSAEELQDAQNSELSNSVIEMAP